MIIFTGSSSRRPRYRAIIKYEAFLRPEIKCSVCLESLNVAERATVVSKWIVNSPHFQFLVPYQLFFYERTIRNGSGIDVTWFIAGNTLNLFYCVHYKLLNDIRQQAGCLFLLLFQIFFIIFRHMRTGISTWEIYKWGF